MHKMTKRGDILTLVKKYVKDKESRKVDFDPLIDRVLVSGKVIGEDEIVNMVDAALDGWLTSGRFNDAFQNKFADFWDKKYCLTVNSGSSANLIAFSTLTSPKLRARQVLPGDEVITVAAGFPTTINPILQNNCIPVFIDVDRNTHNINISLIEQAITKKTKAIMVAHALGNPFDIHEVRKICDSHGLWLIEDCCDAVGAKVNGIRVGALADICTASFYPAHHITMGEGGAVLTDSPILAKIAESFRDWGRDCYCKPGEDNSCGKRFRWKLGDLPKGYDHKYIYSHLGYNLKISDMQAACGLAQMNKLEEFIELRNSNFDYLYESLKNIKVLQLVETISGASPSWFGFPIIIKPESGFSRNEATVFLNDNGIDTRLFFGGNIIKQPYMKDKKFRIHGSLDDTEFLMNNSFWVGVFPGLTRKHLDYMIKIFKEYFK